MTFAGLISLGGLWSLHGAWEPPPAKYVVIHCDDAGMCPAVNAAVIDSIENGCVSSVSIMVPCPGFDEFAEYASSHPERDYGVHLTLTCEHPDVRWGPVLPAESVPSLVSDDGKLWRHTRNVGEHAVLNEAEQELRAQIDRALDRGIRITHLDHHMYVLFSRPDLLDLYLRLGREYDLPVRLQRVVPEKRDMSRRDGVMLSSYQRAVEDQLSRFEPVFNICDADSYNVPAHEKRQHYLTFLRSLQPGVSEILVHCAYDRDGPMPAPAAERRAEDTRVFTSIETEQELRRQGIQVIDWEQLRELQRDNRLGL